MFIYLACSDIPFTPEFPHGWENCGSLWNVCFPDDGKVTIGKVIVPFLLHGLDEGVSVVLLQYLMVLKSVWVCRYLHHRNRLPKDIVVNWDDT